MKLLIVDDEKLTREGLKMSIEWKSLGISDVAIADDGVNGLEIARQFDPDIVLSDVRMPRMTGIEMCEQLQKDNPDLRIVFMSGYSDKEYLKAAIKLKAVSYVEKPIDEEEITEAVREACELARIGREEKASKLKTKEKEIEELAGKLCAPKADLQDLESLIQFNPGKESAFSLLVKLYHVNPPYGIVYKSIVEKVGTILSEHYFKYFSCFRHNGIVVFHVYDFTTYKDAQKTVLGEEIVKALTPLALHFHIVIGKNVEGIHHLYNSYNSAVIELQNCFFLQDKQFLVYQHVNEYTPFPMLASETTDKAFRQYLIDGKEEEIHSFLAGELSRILSYKSILPNQVKDLYYKYFHVVDEVEVLHGMKNGAENGTTSVWGMISDCESVFELDETLRERVDRYLEVSKERTESSSAVAMIKEYVSRNFSNDMLSIKDISEHVFLSTSYACTLFKNETGKTLNQFITEYRIEKAKELLLDPRNRITDISKGVGYSDGNYFGKAFKKQVGVTPSEYREKNQT